MMNDNQFKKKITKREKTVTNQLLIDFRKKTVELV